MKRGWGLLEREGGGMDPYPLCKGGKEPLEAIRQKWATDEVPLQSKQFA